VGYTPLGVLVILPINAQRGTWILKSIQSLFKPNIYMNYNAPF
jgi:hypothetical protein